MARSSPSSRKTKRRLRINECPACGRRVGPKVFTDLWATPRPRTHGWGCAELIHQLEAKFGNFDAFFGKTDGIPGNRFSVDLNPKSSPTIVANWSNLPFRDDAFEFVFWDPPYDKLYRKELREIARVSNRLALLHEYVQPLLQGWEREVVLGITMGPNRRIRCLQIWQKQRGG